MTLRDLIRSPLNKLVMFKAVREMDAVDTYSTRSKDCRNDKCIQNFSLQFRKEETPWETLVKIEIRVILK
jgi:hypothetical protein